MGPIFLLITRGARNSETLILLRESASGKKPLSPLAHGTLFCLSPGSLLLAANCVAASKQETKMRETPKRGFFASFKHEPRNNTSTNRH